MTKPQSTEIAVIGAGVIGLAIALRLANAGHEVTIIDPAAPGSGASYGNAGTIADYAVAPVGTPQVLMGLPSLLLDKSSPLAILPSALPSLAPWLLRFAVQSLPAAHRKNALAIATLLSTANTSWKSLAAEIDGSAILQSRGCFYLYETQRAFASAQSDMAYRKSIGVAVDMFRPDEFAEMEPQLPSSEGGAAFFPDAIFMTDPGKTVSKLAQAAIAAGAKHLVAKVDHLKRLDKGVQLLGEGMTLVADKVVVAAGAYSKPLAAMAGDRVPLDTERGYHLEWDMDEPLLSRPVCPTARGFYLCPMEGRLRAVGTVELGGLTAPPSPHRFDVVETGARALFPHLPTPSRRWMGFRPSMPDSLPVIGPSRRGGDIIHAFGHGHIGLTLAPITARIVADLVEGHRPEIDISPYLSSRFSRFMT
ncbi:MAG: NAD(P)/FAD-dependent oxidoreductase [Marinosulfonomonas sp.]